MVELKIFIIFYIYINMVKTQARTKTIKKNLSESSAKDIHELNLMFNQITGMSDAEQNIIIPKVDKLLKHIQEYTKLYNILLDFKPFTEEFSEYKNWFDEISTFLTELNELYGSDKVGKYESMPVPELNTLYRDIKNNALIKKIIITGSNLSPYKKNLEANPIDDIFIKREPGLILQ